MNTVLLWFTVVLATLAISGLCDTLTVEECLDKVCRNVNLSESVVILRPAETVGTTRVHFKDSETDHNLADLYWEMTDSTLSFGLMSGTSEEDLGGLITYTSLPARDTHDNSYECSIAYHNDHLKVFIEGVPSAAWNISALEAMSEDNKSKISEKVNLDFTSIDELTNSIYMTGRCLEGYHINTDDETCLSCPDHTQSSMYGTGMTKICTDFEKMVQYCGNTVCSSRCSGVESVSPYGAYSWPATLVLVGTTGTVLELPCQYDQGKMARRVCNGNDTWSEEDMSECVNGEITEELVEILEADVLTESAQRELLLLIQDGNKLVKQDILVVYDILNKLTGRGQGSVSYTAGMTLMEALTLITKSEICTHNPSCFWMLELVRQVVPRLENRTVLLLADKAGMFYLQDQLSVLNLYKFCRNTFHDMVTGCENDKRSFLTVMKSELEKLLDGSKRNNVTLSIVFMDGSAFVPALDIITPNQFNETRHAYHTGGKDTVEVTQMVASMVVDLEVNGLSNNTNTNLYFELYSQAVYPVNSRMFKGSLSDGTTLTYQIEYVCAYYDTTNSLKQYLTTRTSWNSLLSEEDVVALKDMGGSSPLIGQWSTVGCDTTFDKQADSPTIHCTCNRTAGSFTVLARLTQKMFPDHYVEILAALTGTCMLGLAMGLLIIFIPAKWMGIPKAAKVNVGVVMVLLLVALYFMVRKMVYELPHMS